jgi:ankyrin repeat protein
MSVPLPYSLVDAMASGDLERVKAILGSDSSLSVNIFGSNLLHIACSYGHIRLFIGQVIHWYGD